MNVKKMGFTVMAAAAGVFMILPFLWMVSASLKRPIDVFAFPIQWIPDEMMWSNYKEVWMNPYYTFYLYYLNSLKVTILSVLGTLLVSSMAAYAFAKLHFWGKNAIFLCYLATLMIPPHVTLVPRFILFHWLDIYNTHWALILPGMFNILGIFLLRQFFMGIPSEISEAAKIDGAGHARVWSIIILPLAKPALVSLMILSFIWNWNDYINPLIFITSKDLYTIPVGLQAFMGMESVQYNLIMAGAACAILPLLILFLILQKYFISGIASSAIKG
ncbi:carbohydrate ABC transporter permease [Paenibacillus sp. J5C_2022]|nr:carbohydrate ABC transporter permease [Paenibacillus sp. J5C2022]MCU6712943.1 carbohydrate ABC transporter permease [Paenibacillus sp. J5C2022]